MSMHKVKVRGQRSRSQKSKQILPQFGLFRSVTPVWIHRWLPNDAQSLQWHRRGVICQISRSHELKWTILIQIEHFWTVTTVWIHWWLRNNAQTLKWYRRGALLLFSVICQISRSQGPKNWWFWPELSVSRLQLQFEFTDGYEIMPNAWSGIEKVPYYFQGHLSNFKFPGAKKSMTWLCFERFWITTPVSIHG